MLIQFVNIGWFPTGINDMPAGIKVVSLPLLILGLTALSRLSGICESRCGGRGRCAGSPGSAASTLISGLVGCVPTVAVPSHFRLMFK